MPSRANRAGAPAGSESGLMSLVAVAWDWYAQNREALAAAASLLGGGALTWAVLQQPAFAARRFRKQQGANRLPSTTEVSTGAAEQLDRNKMRVCLGGILTFKLF